MWGCCGLVRLYSRGVDISDQGGLSSRSRNWSMTWTDRVGTGDEVDVSAVVQIQLWVGKQGPHEVCVDGGDDRVVGAGDQQGGLPDRG